ncbi:MAG: hypothetical protein WCS03_08095 [Bacteroidota bacterium]
MIPPINGLKVLRELAITHSRNRHPNLPEAARCTKSYNDRTANGLTKCIIDFLNFSGHQAERINCTGKMIDNTKIITDVLGDRRSIGSVKWLPTSGQRGTADISSTIKNKDGIGISVKFEVKIKKDVQSSFQKAYQADIERAGGRYFLCHNFDEFLTYYNSINGK